MKQLQVQNISKSFQGNIALSNVSLQICSGSVVAVVGDNGAGKSTLLKCIAGSVAPDSGAVIFNEIDLTGVGPAFARKSGIEMIYQDLAHCPQQTVLNNVFLGRAISKAGVLDHAKMIELCQKIFDDFNVDIPCNAIVGNLSGGQQQAVAIARAMVKEPSLLVMDEPTAALGVKEVKVVLEQIKVLKQKSVAVIMTTHRLADIFEVADRVLVMKHGAIKYDLAITETSLQDLIAKISD